MCGESPEQLNRKLKRKMGKPRAELSLEELQRAHEHVHKALENIEVNLEIPA